MHFPTLLIICFAFVFVICLGLVQVIWDLLTISVHASPHLPVTPHSRTSEEVGERANANELLSATELRDNL
jgi:hypothetical protein